MSARWFVVQASVIQKKWSLATDRGSGGLGRRPRMDLAKCSKSPQNHDDDDDDVDVDVDDDDDDDDDES